jgi:hypothetical protein
MTSKAAISAAKLTGIITLSIIIGNNVTDFGREVAQGVGLWWRSDGKPFFGPLTCGPAPADAQPGSCYPAGSCYPPGSCSQQEEEEYGTSEAGPSYNFIIKPEVGQEGAVWQTMKPGQVMEAVDPRTDKVVLFRKPVNHAPAEPATGSSSEPDPHLTESTETIWQTLKLGDSTERAARRAVRNPGNTEAVLDQWRADNSNGFSNGNLSTALFIAQRRIIPDFKAHDS